MNATARILLDAEIARLEAENEHLRVELARRIAEGHGHAEAARALERELERMAAERRDERFLLIGVARAYFATYRKFGQPGQDTWIHFPRIQGLRQWYAVKALAAIEGELSISDPGAIAERVRAAGSREGSEDGDGGSTATDGAIVAGMEGDTS